MHFSASTGLLCVGAFPEWKQGPAREPQRSEQHLGPLSSGVSPLRLSVSKPP